MLEVLTPLAVAVGRSWVRRERARHRPEAAPLSVGARAALGPFFSSATLEKVRIRVVERLEPPAAIGAVRRLGVPLPLELDRVAGITFDDTVLVLDFVPEAERVPLLFHEAVHVVQYDRLGVDGFVDRYVTEWLAAGRRYGSIPLEGDAYALATRFAADPEDPFDAEAEIERRILARLGAA